MTIYFFRNGGEIKIPSTHSEKLAEEIAAYIDPENLRTVELHKGPGNHPSGSGQEAHGGDGGGEQVKGEVRAEPIGQPSDIPVKNIIDRATASGVTYQPFTQEYPESGYVYSIWSDREKVIPVDDVTSESLEEYVVDNADLLSQDNHYFGGWVEKGQLYLDVSKREDDLAAALKEANETKQLAIFDLDKLETVYTDYYYETQVEEAVPA